MLHCLSTNLTGVLLIFIMQRPSQHAGCWETDKRSIFFFSVSSLLETQPTYRIQFHFFLPGIDLLRTGYSCGMWKSPPGSTRLPPQFRKTTKTLSPNTATCSMTTYFEVLTTSLATLAFIPFSSLSPRDLQSCFLRLL